MRALALLWIVSSTASADDSADLDQLVSEMTAHAPRAAAMDLYARAFAGYALHDRALSSPSEKARAIAELDRLIAQLLDPRSSAPFHAGAVEVAGRRLSSSAALRGHLALLLVGRALLAPLDGDRRALLDSLARSLSRDIVVAPTHLLPTYGRRIWPADNEVIAAALSLYLDRLRGDRSVESGRAALARSLAALDEKGLPPSEISPDRLTARDVPRGCALSWTIAMRALHDRESAKRLWSRYRADYFVDYGAIVGFREWPRGVSRPADADSGPILFGIGVAASAFALGDARLLASPVDETRLRVAATMAGLPALERLRGRPSWPLRAIALWSRSARPW